VEAPDGARGFIIVQAKSRLDPRDVAHVVSQLEQYAREADVERGSFLVIAPYLSPRTQELLDAAGIGFIDSTGNVRLALERPALFIERAGATSNPWTEVRPLRSLKGGIAGRVVRALCDFRPPYGIRELADRSQTPVASISRVVSFLDREAMLTREPRGASDRR
jgi:hypothetical protein